MVTKFGELKQDMWQKGVETRTDNDAGYAIAQYGNRGRDRITGSVISIRLQVFLIEYAKSMWRIMVYGCL